MRTGHTSVQKGKRVKVKLKSGETFIAQFKEKKGMRIQFYDHDEVFAGDTRAVTIYKPHSHQRGNK